ncbi:hypothetical protein J8273_0633 [Carpediemonas membranifera]|uniref:Uncharacterized protein n=1 Tax=Carpediemonas membranifera TaxID=201153 RepID=A0A8J6B7Z6_9EUKA|nr:hypothetical protein J8273_0633 [Carpediemonas membranifera]|eukprot:KAG9397503.1 hypothetical protein J8273_0633 [Carpediemonas membranifera]
MNHCQRKHRQKAEQAVLNGDYSTASMHYHNAAELSIRRLVEALVCVIDDDDYATNLLEHRDASITSLCSLIFNDERSPLLKVADSTQATTILTTFNDAALLNEKACHPERFLEQMNDDGNLKPALTNIRFNDLFGDIDAIILHCQEFKSTQNIEQGPLNGTRVKQTAVTPELGRRPNDSPRPVSGGRSRRDNQTPEPPRQQSPRRSFITRCLAKLASLILVAVYATLGLAAKLLLRTVAFLWPLVSHLPSGWWALSGSASGNTPAGCRAVRESREIKVRLDLVLS